MNVADYSSDIEFLTVFCYWGRDNVSIPVLSFMLNLLLSTKNSKIPYNALADARALSQDYALKYFQ
ncbi:hypothetical protein [Acinetobacter wuhouensis]|uniref:hypothetical protein n=1 Tax=Acinetobacter wuhouensis TaxID=1879050 RepID=UPI00207726BC|nr:hypothetical protein [Acinetobacter wuhouensis]